jgi:hypothetical protein
MKTYFRVLYALLWKESKCEARRKEMFPSMLIFSSVILILFHFTLSSHGQFEAGPIAGVIWVTFAFSGILGLNRSLALEQEAGLMDGLLLAPVDRSVFFVSKLLANWLVLILLALTFIPLVSLFFGYIILNPVYSGGIAGNVGICRDRQLVGWYGDAVPDEGHYALHLVISSSAAPIVGCSKSQQRNISTTPERRNSALDSIYTGI